MTTVTKYLIAIYEIESGSGVEGAGNETSLTPKLLREPEVWVRGHHSLYGVVSWQKVSHL